MVMPASRMLNIFMNGIKVARLWKQSTGNLAFQYENSWLSLPQARPISLSLPLIPTPYTGDKVYNFFDNLLPDNEQIRNRIQRLFHIPTKQPFDLLASIGSDCIGAIQLSSQDTITNYKQIMAEPLTDAQIANLLRNYKQAPLGMSQNSEDFRISIAGAQEKTALLWHENQWYKPLNTTGTSHIFKLPIGFIEHQGIDLSDSCENEWLCSKIAEAFGLQTAHTEICSFEHVKALVVERFDRKLSDDGTWIIRLVQEDICQALGYSPALKYQADGGPGIKDIMNFLLGSQQATEDRKNFFQTQFLFYLLAAIDGHAKNFSIFINAGGRFNLTPLYDIISAYPLLVKGQLQSQRIKLAMALIGANNHYQWHNIQYRHFLSTAKASHYSENDAQVLIQSMLERMDTVIAEVTAQLPANFPAFIADSIFKGLINTRDKMIRSKS
jgi:serine/threonine-protein kinase HipA